MALPLILGMAGAGMIAGAMKDESKSSSGITLGAASGTEVGAQNAMNQSFGQLQSMVQAGPGMDAVKQGYAGQMDLATLLQNMSKEGGNMPTAGDMSNANSFANSMFGAQRVGMQQAFQDQNTNYARQAALMGRDINDPILRAKLAQEQTRQSTMLGAQQGAFATEFAMQQPGQRLGFTQQRAGILSGLATQAMANRQQIAAMGEGIMNNERNFRLATGTRWGNQESGGGLKGALTGGLAGAGMGMGAASAMKASGLFSGGDASTDASPMASSFSGFNYGQPAAQMFGVSGFGAPMSTGALPQSIFSGPSPYAAPMAAPQQQQIFQSNASRLSYGNNPMANYGG